MSEPFGAGVSGGGLSPSGSEDDFPEPMLATPYSQGRPPPGRHHHHVHTGTIVVSIIVLLLVGAAIGALLTPASSPPPISTTPTTVAGSGSSSVSPGAPANAAALASRTAPALVDITVTDAYQAVEGAGTGMVLTSNGIVLTNNHVVEGETAISVRDVGNGRSYGATVLGYDRSQDIAVLQLTRASHLTTITAGASATVAVGDGVVAVGNAEGVGGTPSHAGGKITAVNQSISAQDEVSETVEQLTGLFETNASIVPGYSGGALVNASAGVIGMVTAGSENYQFGSSATAGYAIPMDTARQVVNEIVARQSSATLHLGPTSFLGVQVVSPPSGPAGAMIVSVVSGSPADLAGLSPGDTITGVNGVGVTSPESLTAALLQLKPGRTIQIQYVGLFGQSASAAVTLASGPPQ